MYHNYNNLQLPYYKARLEAMAREIKKLEFEKAQLEVRLKYYTDYE